MENTDLVEHELKFIVNSCLDATIDEISALFFPYAVFVDEGMKVITDIYYDTIDDCLDRNDISYRLRSVYGSKKVRVNFKYPGTKKENVFVRREIRSKVSQKRMNFENPLSIECIANDCLEGYLCKNIQKDKMLLRKSVIVNTNRRCYWVIMSNKDIAGKSVSFGLAYFDDCSYNLPDSKTEERRFQEFEFELWNGGITNEILELQKFIGHRIKNAGYTPSDSSKYSRFRSNLQSAIHR